MENVKPLIQSKTFWGAIVTLLAAILSLGHYTITPAEQANVVDLITGIAGAVGGLYAIYGRVAASKKIG